MYAWIVAVRPSHLCQCSSLARLKTVRKPYSHHAHNIVPCLVTVLLVQARCYVSMLSRQGLSHVHFAGGADVLLRPTWGCALGSLVKTTSAFSRLFGLSWVFSYCWRICSSCSVQGGQSALLILILRQFQCWTVLPFTCNWKLGCMIWFGKQLLSLFFFSVLC